MPKEKREEKKSKKPALAEFALSTKPGNLYGIFPVSARIHEKEKRRCFFSCSAEMFKIMHVCPEHYQIVPFMETAPVGGALIQPTELRTTAPPLLMPHPTPQLGAPRKDCAGPSLLRSSAGGVLLLPLSATHSPSQDGGSCVLWQPCLLRLAPGYHMYSCWAPRFPGLEAAVEVRTDPGLDPSAVPFLSRLSQSLPWS